MIRNREESKAGHSEVLLKAWQVRVRWREASRFKGVDLGDMDIF